MRIMNILLVEDDAIESMKVNRVASQVSPSFSITEAKNGEEAMTLLESKVIFPDVILLDLNMPRMNGIEFLRKMRQNAKLKHIPTVILTTSDNRKDLVECYSIGISGYIVKPLSLNDYQTRLRRLLNYWEVNTFIRA